MTREQMISFLEEKEKLQNQLMTYLHHGLQLPEELTERYNELLLLIRGGYKVEY